MDGKGFFLGLIAAVVLFLLWKKETGANAFAGLPFLQPQAGATVGPQPCASCGPTASAAPSPASSVIAGTDGLISPGSPPLQGSAGAGSFYASYGPTPDNSFTNTPRTVVSPTASRIPTPAANVPGSPTTLATQVPVRAVMPTGSYAQVGFQQRYNIAGIPRVLATRMIQ